MPNGHEMEEIKRLVNKVQDFAEKHKYAYLIPEQMLYVLLNDEKCIECIKKLTTDKNKSKAIAELKKEIADYIEENVEKAADIGNINPTNSYTKLIQMSVQQGAMRSMEPDSLCVFGMLYSDKEQAAGYFLSKHGVLEDDVQEYIRNYREKAGNQPGTEALSKYAVDLTQLARDGKIDPLIGREKECERVAEILSRKRSSNVVIVGESGCVEANTLIRIRKVS